MKSITTIYQQNTPIALRAAAYCRVSTGNDEQLESIDAQKKHFKDVIARNSSWSFAGLYFDEGISGTKKEIRPGLQKLLTDCESGKIDIILTKSISRFARNTTDCLQMVRKLLSLNIPVYFESENLNTANMESELLLTILASIAEVESRSISENNKWASQKLILNQHYKHSCVPYGFDCVNGMHVVKESEAENVRFIFDQVASGVGTQAVADLLNQKHIPPRKGGKWSSSTILDMINNEKYIGDAALQKTYTDAAFRRHRNNGEVKRYYESEHHEAIIASDVFRAAQMVIKQHRREKSLEKGSRRYQKRYAFSGKIICSQCGNKMKRRMIYKGSVGWVCKTHLSDAMRCTMKSVSDDAIKAAFVTMMNKLTFAHGFVLKPYLDAISGRRAGGDKSSLDIIEDKLALLTNQLKNEEIPLAEYMVKRNQLIAREKELQNKMVPDCDVIDPDDAREFAMVPSPEMISAAQELLSHARKRQVLQSFDDNLFRTHVKNVVIESRSQVAFVLKCGLTLREEILGLCNNSHILSI